MFNSKTSSRKMFSRSFTAKLSLGALFAALCVLPACSINANDKHNSKDGVAHVDIKSPMGDLHVSEQADIRDAGLTLYPGAKPAPKDNSDDKKSANVNLSVPGFSLKVVAAEFLSDDAPDKIIAYYNKELQKYGKPIQCHGAWSGGHVELSVPQEVPPIADADFVTISDVRANIHFLESPVAFSVFVVDGRLDGLSCNIGGVEWPDPLRVKRLYYVRQDETTDDELEVAERDLDWFRERWDVT